MMPLVLFLILGFVAVVSALGMLFSRNAIYSALFLILNFGTVAVFYLTLSAPFIAFVQVTVYAGAIMVLFLFVIMLLGAEDSGQYQPRWWYQPAALLLGAVLLVETAYIVLSQRNTLPAINALPEGFGSPTVIGLQLFNEYLLPFEVTSILLLTAMVGAIVLTVKLKKKEVARQVETARAFRRRRDGGPGAPGEQKEALPAEDTVPTVEMEQ